MTDFGFVAVVQMSPALTELKWQLDAEARQLVCISMIPRIAMQRLLHDNVRLFDAAPVSNLSESYVFAIVFINKYLT